MAFDDFHAHLIALWDPQERSRLVVKILYMRRVTDREPLCEISELRNRMQWMLGDRKPEWTALAKLVGVSLNVLLSIKLHCANSSFIAVKKITDTLDISLDELI